MFFPKILNAPKRPAGALQAEGHPTVRNGRSSLGVERQGAAGAGRRVRERVWQRYGGPAVLHEAKGVMREA